MDQKELSDYLRDLPLEQLGNLKHVYECSKVFNPSEKARFLSVLERQEQGTVALLDSISAANESYQRMEFPEKPWAERFGDTYLGMIQYQKLEAEGKLEAERRSVEYHERKRTLRRQITQAILSLPAFQSAFQPDEDKSN